MKCPKCQYIGFDEGDRCRNCGYDFSLASADAPLDPSRRDASLSMRDDALSMRADGDVDGPLADLVLSDRDDEPRRAARQPAPVSAGRRSITPGLDLPLFGGDDDAPLVTPPAVPRAPLSVRRTTTAPPRPTPAAIDLDDPDADPVSARRARRRQPDPAPAAESQPAADPHPVAPAGLRLLAAAIDLAIIGGIDIGIVYFTLRVCGLTFADVGALPPVPLAAFMLLLNGGYATLFTAAAGQTIGKMVTGIRVVPASADAAADLPRMTISTAVIREAACLVSLVPAGLGFLMALVRADGRALHDTLVDTRVVRA